MTLTHDIMESRARIAEFRSWSARRDANRHKQPPGKQARLDGFIRQAVAEKQAVDRVTDELVGEV